jgi:uncharacterized protein (DUF302 family)
MTTIPVEHVRVETAARFDDVNERFVRQLGRLDPDTLRSLFSDGVTLDQVTSRLAGLRASTDLFLFATFDHAAPLSVLGIPARALQHLVGNPMTAASMTRHVRAAALYAPLRVLLYEDARGRTWIEYDLPSSLFGQFGDVAVTAVGRELDRQLGEVVAAAIW